MRKRRSLKILQRVINAAKTKKQKAIAFYNLGLFHDNNGREREAIPNYLNALKLGLNAATRAKALAWLASSLYKTGRPGEGLRRCKESLRITKDKKLRKFLLGLERQIGKSV